MTVGKLGKYLNICAHKLQIMEENYFIEFRPIIYLGGVRDGAVYTKIELKFANIDRANVTDSTDLHRIIDVYNDYQAVTGSLVMSLGHFRSKQLFGGKVRSLSRDIEQNKDCFKSAKICYKTEDYSGFIDLIQDVISDEIAFDIEKRSSLLFSYAKSEMLQRYLLKINTILCELNCFDN